MSRADRYRRRGWEPLATGARRERAREQALAIGETLHGIDAAAIGPSLAQGAAGIALLFAALERAAPARGFGEEAARLADAAIDAVGEDAGEPSLYGGFSGVAWCLEQLREGGDDDDVNGEVDAALVDLLADEPWRGPYDLVGGLCGLGVYAQDRAGRPAASILRARVVTQLAATAQRDAGGARWWTAPRWLASPTRVQHPDGHLNLGLAHGIPGVVALLAGEVTGPNTAVAAPLLDETLRWLLPQGHAEHGFDYGTVPGAIADRARLAWCYGDAGVAVALLLAAHARDDAAGAAAAVAAGQRAAARARDDSAVADASLCHGAAGLMHLFARLHQYSGDPLFAAAALRWLDETLALAEPGRGVAGYRYADESRPDVPGFLEGAAGIGLALLAIGDEPEPTWDRALLLSLAGAP